MPYSPFIVAKGETSGDSGKVLALPDPISIGVPAAILSASLTMNAGESALRVSVLPFK